MTFETLVSIIVFVNLGLTIELWRRAVRRPEKLKSFCREPCTVGSRAAMLGETSPLG
jgi:hypothetical protein